MDEVSIEAMLNEAGVYWANGRVLNGRVLFHHIMHFFGSGLFVFERKRWAFFVNNFPPPEVGCVILLDKTVVNYWWKQPDIS